MSGSIDTLGDALPRELKRCRELVAKYDKLPGGVGAFGAHMIRRDIAAGERALLSGDVVAMLRAYEALKGCQ